MTWQPPAQPPQRPNESSRAVAWAALFFSLVATALAGFVFLKTYDEGRLGDTVKETIDSLRDKTASVLATKKGGAARDEESDTTSAESADPVPEGAQKDTARWDSLRSKVGDIQKMIESGDDRAATMLDDLKSELRSMRDYGSEKTSAAIEVLVEKTEAARASLGTDAKAAGSKMSEMKDELATSVKGATAPKKAKARPVKAPVHEEPADESELPEPPSEEVKGSDR